ncbi:hypothetical protein CAL7716_034520 [Calothrix sp. PCC 7716]|nr:hypothetical protein CAL7716_034520 [Calothrix sp. PCC 7716]
MIISLPVISCARRFVRINEGAIEKHIAQYIYTKTDIGSGLNFKRKKFILLMERVAKGEITNIVVAHKDRLARFGFDFIEWFCNLNGCRIIVLNNTYKPPHQEMMEDFMSIMHCFSSKLYFLRKYEKKILNEVDMRGGNL